ncbi:hypothetical protein GQ53DRAFT_335766 [Thozetella sp. PMI_491]|nr:hypothetical protein GQ53DRAFT_335766 [Thozetella sp. PMI_491]
MNTRKVLVCYLHMYCTVPTLASRQVYLPSPFKTLLRHMPNLNSTGKAWISCILLWIFHGLVVSPRETCGRVYSRRYLFSWLTVELRQEIRYLGTDMFSGVVGSRTVFPCFMTMEARARRDAKPWPR